MENVGLRWYKCDFHLHTMTSSCYQNKDNDTVNDWITEVKNKGLNCIAVTDHNDYREIDEIKKLGEENKTGLPTYLKVANPARLVAEGSPARAGAQRSEREKGGDFAPRESRTVGFGII